MKRQEIENNTYQQTTSYFEDLTSAVKSSIVFDVIVVVIVGVIAWWSSDYIPNIGGVTIAILLGMLVGNIAFNSTSEIQGGIFAEKKILPLSIALLGVELQLLTLGSLGLSALLIIVASITVSIISSIVLGRFFGLSMKFSTLIGAGNGICGASAIAATSVAIDADEADTGISIGVVNLLGTIGIFVLPALIGVLNLDTLQSGLLTGGTLQAFGQVAAAGFSISDDVGNLATVVKMGRIVMLGPVVILLGTWAQSLVPSDSTAKAKVQIPRFIFGFFIMSIIASLGLLPESILEIIKTTGKFLLVVAMAGIGMRIQLQTLIRSGYRALLFGGLISIIQIAVVLVLILILV